MSQLKNQLTNIVQESAIADIIMSNKEDMDLVFVKENHKKWKQHKKDLQEQMRYLQKQLEEANASIKCQEKHIKKHCNHTDLIHHIQPGWDRAQHSWSCNQCGFDLNTWEDKFDTKNVTETIEY